MRSNRLYLIIFLLSFLTNISFNLNGEKKQILSEQTSQQYVTMGEFIRDWMICGIFPNPPHKGYEFYNHIPPCVGLDTDYLKEHGGESNIKPTSDIVHQKPNGEEIKWFKYESPGNSINFASIFKNQPTNNSIVYAYTTLQSAEEITLSLAIGSDDGIKIWLNGEIVHEKIVGRGINIDDDLIIVKLKKGDNSLLLKLENGVGGFGFICRMLSEVADSLKISNRTKLKDMGLYSYFNKEELNGNIFDEEWLDVIPLSYDDINEEFSNINDLKWLKDVALKNKVILFGENHYYKYIHHLLHRFLFALNTYDYYPLLVMESQYSNSAFVNHYLNISDDENAKHYFINVIYEMITSEEEYDLLNHIRRWNKLYPNKKISIGYSDIEHDFKTTIKNILLPYFIKIDKDLSIAIDDLEARDLGELIIAFDTLLTTARKSKLIGDYPFITAEYISTVIENLRSLYHAYVYIGGFDYYRQKAIIRNLTDPKFLGKFLINYKMLIHGGSYHTPTHYQYPENANFFREGSYLSFDFDLTKGKTLSIKNQGISRNLGDMAYTDISSCIHQGSGYQNSLAKLQHAYNNKLIFEHDYIFEWNLDDFHRIILKKAVQYENNPILIKNIYWDKLLNKAELIDKNLLREIKRLKEDFSQYDIHIFIPQSPITSARRKQ